MTEKTISVIGGGASGMASAIEAAEYAIRNGSRIHISVYERLPKLGKKILATGNGRCNIMNVNTDIDMYRGDKKMLSNIFGKFSPESNMQFFKKMGVYLSEEEDGRLYPMSFQATSVLDAMKAELELLGVEIVCDKKIETIERSENGFLLNGEIETNAVIIAGGGQSSPVQGSDGSCYQLLNSLGIKIRCVFPSLTGIILRKKNKFLKGTRSQGEILIVENGKVISSSSGELQYTDYGVSGIPAMEVSRDVSEHFAMHRKGKIIMSVNSLPDFSPEEIFEYIMQKKRRNPSGKTEDLLSGLMPKKLGISKLEAAGIKTGVPISELTKNDIAALTEIINSDIFEIGGVLGFDNSQVTAGGADTSMFSRETLEAKSIENLYACGEVLDVDGRCGGYNLAWAWSSGRCAGYSAAKKLSENQQCSE